MYREILDDAQLGPVGNIKFIIRSKKKKKVGILVHCFDLSFPKGTYNYNNSFLLPQLNIKGNLVVAFNSIAPLFIINCSMFTSTQKDPHVKSNRNLNLRLNYL